jgi:hypothetical protein
MFSQGQLIFGGFFLVAFIIAIIFLTGRYKNSQKFYKGNYKYY